MPATKPITLDPNEFALIVGEEDGSMTVRVESSTEPSEEDELPEPAQLVVALAQRLLKDPRIPRRHAGLVRRPAGRGRG